MKRNVITDICGRITGYGDSSGYEIRSISFDENGDVIVKIALDDGEKKASESEGSK